jgi:peptide-methionine (R)-S-oxide reductase
MKKIKKAKKLQKHIKHRIKPKILVGILLGIVISIALLYTVQTSCAADKKQLDQQANQAQAEVFEITKTETEWKKELTPEQYDILREKGTERAFTGKLLKNKEKGVYTCGACGNELFSSEHKYDSGTGWPSFWDAIDEGAIKLVEDTTFGMKRVEIVCGRCGSHLGHLFEDGPEPTGKRYCINSAALEFKKTNE